MDTSKTTVGGPKNTTTNIAQGGFVVIKATEDDTLKLSPFSINRGVKALIGEVLSIKTLRSGELLVQTASAAQTTRALNLKEFMARGVECKLHRTLNHVRGLIRCMELTGYEHEIVENMREQGVTGVRTIGKKGGTFVLTYAGTRLPERALVGHLSVPVRTFIPNPTRCFGCHKFGHVATRCKGEAVCAKCGQAGHDYINCTETTKCVNCAGAHPASSKACPRYKAEFAIQKLKVERGISFYEARKPYNRDSETPRYSRALNSGIAQPALVEAATVQPAVEETPRTAGPPAAAEVHLTVSQKAPSAAAEAKPTARSQRDKRPLENGETAVSKSARVDNTVAKVATPRAPQPVATTSSTKPKTPPKPKLQRSPITGPQAALTKPNKIPVSAPGARRNSYGGQPSRMDCQTTHK